jgi:2-desacetyl-2-hydroxyethyl bacteriochlorophyllide A dehydrogenase
VKAAVVRARGALAVESVPEPTFGDYEALVEILACGVCTGTDAHIVAGQFPRLAPYPFILGHESIGRVRAIGARVRYLAPGDLVLRPVAVRPGETLGGYGSAFGGLAELGVVADARALVEDTPRDRALRLPTFADAQQVVPADFDPLVAGAFITFKETLSWLHQLGPVAGRSVLVLGTGPVGLCFARIAKLLGARPVIAVGRRVERLALAMQLGADAGVNSATDELIPACRALTGGRGADVVIEAIGDTELLGQTPQLVADGGQVGVYGVPPALEMTLRWAGGPPSWQLRFVRPQEAAVHDLALDLVRRGFVDLRGLVSHVLPLARVGEAFDLVASKAALKPTIQIASA